MTKIEKPTLTEDILNILRLLSSGSDLSQRDVSSHLEISLGKTNYLLKSLIKKNLIKAMNFSRNRGKLGKVRYILTKKGLEEKVSLMYHFLKKKESEYNHIREELAKLEGQSVSQNQEVNSGSGLSYLLKGGSDGKK
ncbi:MAG: MarR family EPS-associated transcriptional regulator [Candidatus Omnitrophica bacterium]|nr:MarR family EPS-associated transcriptional regulator [Candidatus Omnitrophota bacterium]